jgi:hypothetical protein
VKGHLASAAPVPPLTRCLASPRLLQSLCACPKPTQVGCIKYTGKYNGCRRSFEHRHSFLHTTTSHLSLPLSLSLSLPPASPVFGERQVPDTVYGSSAQSKCLARKESPISGSHSTVQLCLVLYVCSDAQILVDLLAEGIRRVFHIHALLHWFPLADQAIEPTTVAHVLALVPILTHLACLCVRVQLSHIQSHLLSLILAPTCACAHSSVLAHSLPPALLCTSTCAFIPLDPHLLYTMLTLGRFFQSCLRADIPHPLPQQADVIYHPTTHECTFIPPHLRAPRKLNEILRHLNTPLGEYVIPEVDGPITTFQLLSAWARFSPSAYNGTYFQHNAQNGTWAIDRVLMGVIQMGIEILQGVITDTILLVGEERHLFSIDRDYALSEKLWTPSSLGALKSADKLLKLRVELTLTRLEKLRNLHASGSPAPVAGLGSLLPYAPELSGHLQSIWQQPLASASGKLASSSPIQGNASSEATRSPLGLTAPPGLPVHSTGLAPARLWSPQPDLLPHFGDISMEPQGLATILHSPGSPGSPLSIDPFYDEIWGVLRVRWLHDPGGLQVPTPFPLVRPVPVVGSLQVYARSKAPGLGFPGDATTGRAVHYCLHSGSFCLPFGFSAAFACISSNLVLSPMRCIRRGAAYHSFPTILSAW